MTRLIARALALILVTAAPVGAAQEQPDTLVIRDVTVIDGTGAAPRGPLTVVAEEGRITAIAAGARRRVRRR